MPCEIELVIPLVRPLKVLLATPAWQSSHDAQIQTLGHQVCTQFVGPFSKARGFAERSYMHEPLDEDDVDQFQAVNQAITSRGAG